MSPEGVTAEPLIVIDKISKRFPLGRRSIFQPPRVVHAVDRVSMSITKGRTLALVGESGSGKTTLGQIVAGLLEPTEGNVVFEGTSVTTATQRTRRRMRRQLQFIFQDPFSSLNPRHTIRTILSRPYKVHTELSQREIERELRQLLTLVGLAPPGPLLDRHPHQFSGGQRQRIVFARAIALRPKFIVADEPVSSLDMSVKAQLLTLLRDFQTKLDLTYLFITHELAVVRTIAQDVAVMYLGRVVEHAPTADVFERPLHPYTTALLSSTPTLDPRATKRERTVLGGTMPSPVSPPPGCHFHTRCPYARALCSEKEPPLRQIGPRRVACHFVGQPAFPHTANLSADLIPQALATSEPYPDLRPTDASPPVAASPALP